MKSLFKTPPIHTIFLAGLVILTYLIFKKPLDLMFNDWMAKPEYSHAILIPVIAGFFIFQRKNDLAATDFSGSWAGFVLTLCFLLVGLISNLGNVYFITQLSVILIIFSVALCYLGKNAFLKILPALLVLIFAIPLPEFLYGLLSRELQLISSQIGVFIIRALDISVYLEGNVIDLGIYKLQVVDACSGLRYLFPLMCFGFICAYIYNARFWQRIVVFLTTIPITVFMNSFRIGVIGILVNTWGIEHAEGFLHDFEGWVVFMACVGILFLEMWFMAVILNKESSLNDVFAVEMPAPLQETENANKRNLPKPLLALIPIFVLALVTSQFIGQRTYELPEREEYITFPEEIQQWKGQRNVMEQVYIDALRGMTDYALIDYRNDDGQYINFYAAYYPRQDASGSIHSPRNCIPGGGWEITDLKKIFIPSVANGEALKVNRAIIEMNEHKQLTYYWFHQRGRIITNEYMAKWYQLIDSIVLNRTDGTLVRLITNINPDEPVEDADKRLVEFINLSYPQFDKYMPD